MKLHERHQAIIAALVIFVPIATVGTIEYAEIQDRIDHCISVNIGDAITDSDVESIHQLCGGKP